MLMKQTRFGVISVLLITVVLLTACSPGSPLLGKWEGTDPNTGQLATLEFKSDGKVEMVGGGATIEGTYEMVDADTFSMKLTFLGEELPPQMVDFVRSGDTLTLITDGETQVLHKTQ